VLASSSCGMLDQGREEGFETGGGCMGWGARASENGVDMSYEPKSFIKSHKAELFAPMMPGESWEDFVESMPESVQQKIADFEESNDNSIE